MTILAIMNLAIGTTAMIVLVYLMDRQSLGGD